MIETYKYTYGIYVVADLPFQLDMSVTRGHSLNKDVIQHFRLKFFSFRVVNVWNAGLPDTIRLCVCMYVRVYVCL